MKITLPRPTATLLPLLLLLLACAHDPGSTVESFYRHVDRGELDDALELVSSNVVSQLGKDKLRAGLQRVTRDMAGKGGLDEIEIAEETVTGEVAEVEVVLHFGDGSTEKDTTALVQEDGTWKLQPEK